MQREIILKEYSNDWVKRFEDTKRNLELILSDEILEIHHFGSTSIEGMKSKDTVDVLVLVKDIESINKYDNDMESNGYIPKGENGIPGRRYYQKFSYDNINHLLHIHIYQQGSDKARDEIIFRDYLRENKEAFDKYLKVKKEASNLYRKSPNLYQDHKNKVILELLQEAKNYFYYSEEEKYDAGFSKGNTWFRYRAAAIITENGKVLLASNSKNDYYYSVGGGVHVGETSEQAVVREVFEETGIMFEIDKIAIIHENIYLGTDSGFEGVKCHEICFYYKMKSKGLIDTKHIGYNTNGDEEIVEWIEIDKLDRIKSYPTFLKKYLLSSENEKGLVHIVDNRIENIETKDKNNEL